MKIQINITKEILEESKWCTNGAAKTSMVGQNCAIGRAIWKLFGDKSWVGGQYISYFPKGLHFEPNGDLSMIYSITIEMPEEAIYFIMAFDNSSAEERVHMQPFYFEIDVQNTIIEDKGIS